MYLDRVDTEKIVSNMTIDLIGMEFKSTDEHQLTFQSIEHRFCALLKYFIKEQDVEFIRHGKEAYVQAKFYAIEAEDQTGNGEGYVETELNLYKVSE